MTTMLGIKPLVVLCLGALLASGCGDDAKQKGVEREQDAAVDDAGVELDAGDDVAEEPADAGKKPGSRSDAGTQRPDPGPGTQLSWPIDGKHLSLCYGDADCTDEGLACYGAFRAAPGFCSAVCKSDDDCDPIAGIEASCGPDGQCRVDCSGADDKGDGACPKNMQCRDFFDLSVVGGSAPSEPGLIAIWRCGYPVDAGSHHVAAYGRCDLEHGHGDCKADLLCHAPSSRLSRPTNPGYCSEACEAPDDCHVPSGASAAAVCEAGACELDCAAPGATCPSGMNCRQVGTVNPVQRCRFISE